MKITKRTKHKMDIGKAYSVSIPHMGYKVIYGVNPREFVDDMSDTGAMIVKESLQDMRQNVLDVMVRMSG